MPPTTRFGPHLIVELRALVVVQDGRAGTAREERLPWLAVDALEHNINDTGNISEPSGGPFHVRGPQPPGASAPELVRGQGRSEEHMRWTGGTGVL